MNYDLLSDFKAELKDIHDYINYSNHVNNLLNYDAQNSDSTELQQLLKLFQTHHQEFRLHRKMFEYKSIIISLYGILEKYIKTWVKAYLESLVHFVPYSALNSKIQEHHWRFSMALINMIIEGKWTEFNRLDKKIVLQNLHECAQEVAKYQLNTDAFLIQAGNLKHSRILQMFDTLGISLTESLLKNKALTELTGSIDRESLYGKINDLVDRRNTVAHGAHEDNLLDHIVLQDYIGFLEIYGTAVFETLVDYYLQQEVHFSYQEFKAYHVWRQHSCVGITFENYTVKEGDLIIIRTPLLHFFKTKIVEIQYKKQSYQELTVTEEMNVGIKVNASIVDTYKFYFLKKL